LGFVTVKRIKEVIRLKKYLYHIIFLMVSATLLISCQSSNTTPHVGENGSNLMEAGSNEVIAMHGRIENIAKLDSFVQNVQSKKVDDVQLTRYTIEGDPIYHKLNYNSEKIEIIIDASKDKFGSGEIFNFECKTIKKQEINTETKYILEGCPDPQTRDFFTILHDVSREDYFAFDLKYGIDKTNQINTKDQKLVLDLENGKKAVADDIQFSTVVMNDIYKLMVFSNYLEEKQLANKCEEKSGDSYELTIWINSAERHIEWDSCDTSADGKEMSQLVADIVRVIEQTDTYKLIK
jgi:hypothetical protein